MDVIYPFAGVSVIALVVAIRARSGARQLEVKARELESATNRAESRAVDAEHARSLASNSSFACSPMASP
jgi:hypothetical protein